MSEGGDEDNNDEYMLALTAPTPGEYDAAIQRRRRQTWMLCDLRDRPTATMRMTALSV